MSTERPTTPERPNSRKAQGSVSRLGSLLVNLLLVTTLLAAAAYTLPSLFGYQHYVITGGSMSGTFERGSVVFSEVVPSQDLQVGDVITYLPPSSSGVDTLVTHRVIRIGRDELGRQVLRTQGDANSDPDPWRFTLTDSEQAVVRVSVPYVGHALIALADRDTRRMLIGVPAGLVGLLALFQLIGALRPDRDRPARDRRPGTTVTAAGV